MTEAPADIAKLPFEAALAELETIVEKLEKGAVALEESIKIYERGEALKAHCDKLLRNAEMRNEKITYKVREHSLAKVPVLLVVGRKEATEKTVSIRRLGSNDQRAAGMAEALDALAEEARAPDQRG